MPPRSRRSAAATAAAPEVVEEEEQVQVEEDGLRRLQFKQPLVGRPAKPISVSELLARLKTLLDELRSMDQEGIDKESFVTVTQELASQNLLQHKDNGVRAWTVCCIVDVLRVFVPDAPYPGSKLKEIFTTIVTKILPNLSDPSHPYNSQHMYVLRSLSDWKSILLINDIPGSEQLTSALFANCFDILNGPSKSEHGEELSKNVEHNMTEILSTVIDEAPSIPHDVVDVILAQFLWADPHTFGGSGKGKKSIPIDSKQSTLRRKDAPPAYNMAKNVCNSHPGKMARLIGNYFKSVLVNFTSDNNFRDGKDESGKGPSEEEFNEASKAHRLLRELWKCCPGTLQEIIPHLQDELAAENVQLRQLATEAFGDMISGIGAAGPPPLPELDPAAYPSQSLSREVAPRAYNFLTTPASINSFPTQYPVAYHSFLQRKNDKSAIIRAAWTTGIGRILMTSAGGIGLDPEEEQKLLKYFAECLIDSDEKVRLAAIKAVEYFEFKDIISKLGSTGSMSESGSILSNLADRIKDKKSVIHSETIKLLGRIWGVASGAIAEGDDTVKALLGPIPTQILNAVYINDKEINMHVDTVLYESLLPLSYPPMKPKAAANGNSQAAKDSQANGEQNFTEAELDKIRTERQLVLVNGLDERAKKVYFSKQGNLVQAALFMDHFLKACEDYNGGVVQKGGNGKESKARLEQLIPYFVVTLPDPSRVTDDLWKFIKAHDRRTYALIRFCMDPTSDYRRVFKSIKELKKRIEDGPGASVVETITILVYRVSLLCYNKSHVPAIIEFTRTNDKSLGATAHELLKEVSTKNPKVFSTHVKDLCQTLENEAPTAKSPNPPGAVDDLKACAAFAKKFPTDIPLRAKEGRKLTQSLLNFALYGAPPTAAKHAIAIITQSDPKKELHIKEILTKSIKEFRHNGDHWLTKLAALSQIVLLAPSECEDSMDSITEIAIEKVLAQPHELTTEAEEEWMEAPDEDLEGRKWALKILVNRLRSADAEADLKEAATGTYALLNRLVKNHGDESDDDSTPAGHRSRQRLLAACSLLKLATSKHLDSFLTPQAFIELALVTHDGCAQVRKGFAEKLMKYLGQGRLPARFYTILFYFAYESDSTLKTSIMTWIRSRRVAFAARKEVVLETVFARLLSLLAHHPDYEQEDETLKLFSKYILYYLSCVATEDNLSLIFHIAQRVKGVAEGIKPSTEGDERLYVLSDLSQALIRAWDDQNNWSMQSWPGKMKLPSGIFRPLQSHEHALKIAKKSWISEELIDELDVLVRKAVRSKKRKATDGVEKPRKKSKSDKPAKERKPKGERPVKTPKSRRRGGDDDEESDQDIDAAKSTGPRRKSGRQSTAHKSYIEVSSEDEAVEVEADDGEEDAESSEADADEDVEMEQVDDEEEEQQEPSKREDSPDPEPQTKSRRTASKKTEPKPAARNSRVASAKSTPAKASPKVTKGKPKANGAAASSPAASGTRRSGRTRV